MRGEEPEDSLLAADQICSGTCSSHFGCGFALLWGGFAKVHGAEGDSSAGVQGLIFLWTAYAIPTN